MLPVIDWINLVATIILSVMATFIAWKELKMNLDEKQRIKASTVILRELVVKLDTAMGTIEEHIDSMQAAVNQPFSPANPTPWYNDVLEKFSTLQSAIARTINFLNHEAVAHFHINEYDFKAADSKAMYDIIAQISKAVEVTNRANQELRMLHELEEKKFYIRISPACNGAHFYN